MARILAGKAAVHGVDGTLLFSGLLATENKLTAADLGDEFDLDYLEDGAGEIVGVAATSPKRTATFNIIPFDPSSPSTLTTAKTKVVLPTALATVTVASTGVASIDGTWNYAGGGRIGISKKGYVVVTLPCFQVGGAALSVVAS
jgi:hypothetical protein